MFAETSLLLKYSHETLSKVQDPACLKQLHIFVYNLQLCRINSN